MSENISSFSEAELRHLGDMARVMLKLVNDISLSQLAILLTIARQPGLSVNALAECTGLPQQTVSRIVGQLSGRYSDNPIVPPMDYVEYQIDGEDARRRAIFITDSGVSKVRSTFF